MAGKEWCVVCCALKDLNPEWNELTLKGGSVLLRPLSKTAGAKGTEKFVLTPGGKATPPTARDNRICEVCVSANGAAVSGGGGFKPKVQTVQQFSSSNYKLVKRLGDGAYGDVHLGQREGDDTYYAIKIIEKSKLTDKKAEERVMREIDALQSIRHPNVIGFFERIDSPSQIFVVMEYAGGGDLYDYVDRTADGCLDEATAAKFFIQICSAVDFIHSQNYIHRDLKPENVLLDKQLNVKLGDFGFTNQLFKNGERNILNTPCGSPIYVAPEIINSQPQTEKLDIWSLGVLLYVLVTGASPWDDGTGQLPLPQQFAKIKKGDYVRVDSSLSKECVAMLDAMLKVDPKERISLKDAVVHPWFQKYGLKI